jgi:hypothetical protein
MCRERRVGTQTEKGQACGRTRRLPAERSILEIARPALGRRHRVGSDSRVDAGRC